MINKINFILLSLIDIIILILLFYITLFIRDNIYSSTIPPFIKIDFINFSFAIVIALFLFFNEKIYSFRYDFWQESKKIIKSLFLTYLLVLTILALTKTNQEYSRLFITIYFILAMILIPITKIYIKKLLYSFDFLLLEIKSKKRDLRVNLKKTSI